MIEIDINKLKQDLKDYYGAALMQSFDIDNLSDEEIINKAIEIGLNIENYIVNSSNKKLSR